MAVLTSDLTFDFLDPLDSAAVINVACNFYAALSLYSHIRIRAPSGFFNPCGSKELQATPGRVTGVDVPEVPRG